MVTVGTGVTDVVIRGIPKEGWKLGVSGVADGEGLGVVVIRGIPKEGWKRGGHDAGWQL